MTERPKVLVGKSAIVREPKTTPAYFTATHRARIGATGVVHAIVRTESADDPLIKLKFPPDDRIVFFRLSDIEVQPESAPPSHERHGRAGRP